MWHVAGNDMPMVQPKPIFVHDQLPAWIMDPDGNKVELWEPKLWDEKNKGV